MFQKQYEEEVARLSLSANFYYALRGDEYLISNLLVDDSKEKWNWDDVMYTFWDMSGDEPKAIQMPRDISLLYSYLSGDTLIYFQKGEGYYKMDLTSGEKVLLQENQLEYGQGVMLSDKYFVECNKFGALDTIESSNETYMKVYNGKEWLDVEIPKEIKQTQKNLSVVSLASDRIFILHSSSDAALNLYYIMLDTKTPELIYCDKIGGDDSVEESSEISSETAEKPNDGSFEEVIVFDTDDYLFKITGITLGDETSENLIQIEYYIENKTKG